MQDLGCDYFIKDSNDPSRKDVVTKGSKHGPVAQVVMSTLAHVLRGRAALGGSIPQRIPAAVILGRKKKKKDANAQQTDKQGEKNSAAPSASGGSCSGKNNWALVHLATPLECGGQFTIGVDASGSLLDDGGAEQSLAAYLTVMTSGMRAASEWLYRVGVDAQHIEAPPALISGRALYFGDVKLPLPRMIASPVGRYKTNGFRITQGELLELKVDLRRLRSTAPTDTGIFWFREGNRIESCDVEGPILIKVTSFPCINLLVRSTGSLLFRLGAVGVERNVEVLVDTLAPSIHALYRTEANTGLVQLLPNLVA
jgi:hypothetical protein